ncbi:ATP-binding cassette domain-containing protein [Micromonospora zamorensis]|uniref:ATP-binding cassette domain-containing protein n=1 Tax=Micromonospora zamorensis TaxID=709883 RepID=UPI00371E9A19
MIKARGLTKTFQINKFTVEAVRGIDLDVSSGEMVGFLGPNGAGKSTTLRMLTTLLRPTSGEANIGGCDLLSDPAGVRKLIGYVGQNSSAGVEYKVREELVTHARLQGLSASAARTRVAEMLDQYDLTGLEDRMIGALSGGQKRRIDIVMGVLHRPPVVFFDEPSTGLDPQSRSNLWDHIRNLRRDYETTVFLTTHYLDEADSLCDRILVIDGGRIVAEGTADELKAQVNGDLVTLETSASPETAAAAERLDGATEVTVDGATVRFRIARGDRVLPGLLRELDRINVDVFSVRTSRPTLDDVFLTVTGRSLRDSETAPAFPGL